jgi:hypothetical protein
MNENPIRGKVARVLSSRELVMNVGCEHGVSVGMYFDVLDPKGENITDPDSEEVLGSVERAKVRVRVVRVQERLSIASTFRKQKVNVGGVGPVLDLSRLSRMYMPPEWITKYETLKTSETTWEDLDEKESYVKTGDPVVQVMTKVDEGEE